ncbi:MAG: hypothetical protein ANABAC_1269 [Anaerolineae bacterium]|nr:MAG: hypothetical protein ANABAC_1269 [Anaerolineae bacterium]
MIFAKSLHDLTECDIQSLIERQVAEGIFLDYKLELPDNSDESKKEFLADVSSFANTSGGCLIFGIREEDRIPVEVVGLEINPDAEINRLENIIRDGLAPRVFGIGIESVKLSDEKYIIVIQIPQSYSAPHMVVYKNSSRFFARNSAGKYQMDVHELRRAFLLSETVADRIRDFRIQRVARIIAGETPVPLVSKDRFMLILHFIPYSSFAIKQDLDLQVCTNCSREYFYPHTFLRFNLDGLVFFLESSLVREYYQSFRSGQVEYVYCGQFSKINEQPLLPSKSIEDTLINVSWNCLRYYQAISIEAPLFVLLTLSGVKGTRLELKIPYPPYFNNAQFDRDPVFIPEVMLDSFPATKEELPNVLKPLRDAMWNASGFDSSPYFKEN